MRTDLQAVTPGTRELDATGKLDSCFGNPLRCKLCGANRWTA